jgi:hypothetical protein
MKAKLPFFLTTTLRHVEGMEENLHAVLVSTDREKLGLPDPNE